MNMQAIMKQAQKVRKDMLNEKKKVEENIYEGTSSLVSVKVKGSKEVIEIKINSDMLEKDDIEMVQDMIVIAINDAMKKIDNDMETKLGKYTNGIPGLF